MEYTKGTWYTLNPAEGMVAHEETGNTIARCIWALNDEEYQNNCRLIAAAPELLEALKDIQALLWGAPIRPEINKAFYIAEDAIEKAEGK